MMYKEAAGVLLSLGFCLSAGVCHAAPILVGIKADNAFLPVGFDDNDDVQFVLDGWAPNSCYKPTTASVKIDSQEHVIKIEPKAYYYGNGVCLMVIVPYIETVNLGLVPSGKYRVEVPGVKDQTVTIKHSLTLSPDDYPYAPVENAHVDVVEQAKTATAVIEGQFTNTCMSMDRVLVHDNGDTIEVQPIVKMAEGPTCREAHVPFKEKVALNWRAPGRYLLHVRSLRGHAVNTVFEIF